MHSAEDHASNPHNTFATRRNLTRNMNRKTQLAFAREMKESLATGRPASIKLPESQTDLKARRHVVAKEVAYKLLDLSKENMKNYIIFEKALVHTELNAQYKFDPPIHPKRVDKYLSGHLRTSRAIWNIHWLKYGDSQRHHNCPTDAWAKLIKLSPTSP